MRYDDGIQGRRRGIRRDRGTPPGHAVQIREEFRRASRERSVACGPPLEGGDGLGATGTGTIFILGRSSMA